MDGAALVDSALGVVGGLMPDFLPIFGVFAGLVVVGVLMSLVLRKFF